MTLTTLHTLTGLTWRTSPKDKRDPAASRHVAQVGDFLVTVADYLRADDTLDLDVRLARVDFPFTEPPAVPIIGVAYADLAGAIGDALARCVVAALQGEWLDEPADLHNLDLPDAIRADYHAALREDAGSAKVRAERHAALFGAIVDGLTP